MSEIREALENIGRRFTPPDQSVEKIMAGVGGMRRRRLLGMTLVVVLAGIPLAAGAWALLSAPPRLPSRCRRRIPTNDGAEGRRHRHRSDIERTRAALG